MDNKELEKFVVDFSKEVVNKAVSNEVIPENKEALNIVIDRGDRAKVTLLSGKVKEIDFNCTEFSLGLIDRTNSAYTSIVIVICDEAPFSYVVIDNVITFLNVDVTE